MRWAAAVAVVTALLLPLATGEWKLGVAFGLSLALWLVAATVTGVVERVRGVPGVAAKLRRQPLSYWAMVVAHLGVAAFVVGVTMVKGYEVERDVKMNIGDTVAVAGYVFRFDGVSDARGPNYRAARGTIAVSRGGTVVKTLHPEKRSYNAGGQPMTNAAIDSGPFGDLYVSMGEPVGDGAWSHSRLLEAVHHLGMGRLHHDGDRRLPRRLRPPLSRGRAARHRAGACRDGGRLGPGPFPAMNANANRP